MPTIGHLVIGIYIPLLMFYILSKKFSIEIVLYFIVGSILPDIYTIIKIFIYPDIYKYIPWNVPHGFLSWIVWGFITAAVLYLLFHRISKLRVIQIFTILLSAGWLHLGLDMTIQQVRIVGDFYLSFSSFYTQLTILGEQDLIVIFYIIFIITPILLLVIEVKKIENK